MPKSVEKRSRGTLARLAMTLALALATVGCETDKANFEEPGMLDKHQEGKLETLFEEAQVIISAFKRKILTREVAAIQLQSLCDKVGEVIHENNSDGEEVTPLRIHHTGFTILLEREGLRDGIQEIFSEEIPKEG